MARFPQRPRGKPTWGAGFQVGLYYEPMLELGSSYKSPQWFDPFRRHSLDSVGVPLDLTRSFTLDFAWVHACENSIRGPVLELPDTTITLRQSLDFWSFGLGARY